MLQVTLWELYVKETALKYMFHQKTPYWKVLNQIWSDDLLEKPAYRSKWKQENLQKNLQEPHPKYVIFTDDIYCSFMTSNDTTFYT